MSCDSLYVRSVVSVLTSSGTDPQQLETPPSHSGAPVRILKGRSCKTARTNISSDITLPVRSTAGSAEADETAPADLATKERKITEISSGCSSLSQCFVDGRPGYVYGLYGAERGREGPWHRCGSSTFLTTAVCGNPSPQMSWLWKLGALLLLALASSGAPAFISSAAKLHGRDMLTKRWGRKVCALHADR